jgi:hypothetical protein
MNTLHKSEKNCHPLKCLLARSALVLTLVLAAVAQVQADGLGDRFSGGEWRLGNHNQIYQRTNRGWQRVQGSAIAVADGWVIGTDRRSGGYGIYRWNGYSFDRMPGGAVDIGGSYERPWVVNNRGERFEWTGRDWREVRGYGSNRSARNNERHHDENEETRYNRRDDYRHDHRDDSRRPSW